VHHFANLGAQVHQTDELDPPLPQDSKHRTWQGGWGTKEARKRHGAHADTHAHAKHTKLYVTQDCSGKQNKV